MSKDTLFATNCKGMSHSAIGELLSATKTPGFISFAAGVPASEFFPVEELKLAAQKVFEEEGRDILQYGDQLGMLELRKHIAKRVDDKFSYKASPEDILITSGAQQGIDTVGRLFLEAGDSFIVEKPTYVDALNTLSFTGAKAKELEGDDEGISLSALEKELKENKKVKLIYVIPDFQNPTGKCWSLKRRQAFMELVSQYEVIVLEDNPYGELTYMDKTIPALKSLDAKEQVITLGSFSKILSPGLRVGWIASSPSYSGALSMVKERTDVHSSNLDQAIITTYLNEYSIEDHLVRMCKVYKERRDAMVRAVEKYMPTCQFTTPEGGLFLWLTLPAGMNVMEVFAKAIEEKVAFVPGTPFYVQQEDVAHLRMNFSGNTPAVIEEGIKKLGNIINNY